ncbi:MAG: AI-2E family transporter [Caldilineaceae bacterium]|nr:AI-2E family transporter [Caldilineaceae bacterium]
MTFGEFFKRVLAVFAVLLLVSAVWAARSTLLLGFAAALIAVSLSILSGWLQRRGFSHGWAVICSVVIASLMGIALLLLMLPRLLGDSANLLYSIPAAVAYLVEVYANARDASRFLQAALPALPAAGAAAAEVDPERARAILNQLFNASLTIMPSFFGGLGTVAGVVFNLFFVLVIAVYLVIDPKGYVKASLFLFPEHFHARVVNIWNELYRTIRAWLTAMFWSITITVALVWLIMGVVLGMPNAIVVAAFAGLATFIPNIGAFLPLIPIAIFSLASDNPAQIFVMIPVYLIIQLVESSFITPSIVKAGLKIPPGGLMIFQLLITIPRTTYPLAPPKQPTGGAHGPSCGMRRSIRHALDCL